MEIRLKGKFFFMQITKTSTINKDIYQSLTWLLPEQPCVLFSVKLNLWFDLGYIPYKVKDVTLIEPLAVKKDAEWQEVLPQAGFEPLVPALAHVMRQLVYKERHLSQLRGGVYLRYRKTSASMCSNCPKNPDFQFHMCPYFCPQQGRWLGDEAP